MWISNATKIKIRMNHKRNVTEYTKLVVNSCHPLTYLENNICYYFIIFVQLFNLILVLLDMYEYKFSLLLQELSLL